MKWEGTGIGEHVNDLGTVVGILDSFSFPLAPDDSDPVMIAWTEGIESTLHVRLKKPFDDNLIRLNEEMQHVYPQNELLFRSMEKRCEVIRNPFAYSVMSLYWHLLQSCLSFLWGSLAM